MSTYTVSASSVLDAPPATCYAIIADYRRGHPQIVPPSVFGAIEVEAGGIGAGTLIKVDVRGIAGSRTLRLAVSEPEPGRVLAETDVERGTVTHFVVEPAGVDDARVTISTTFPSPTGLAGRLEAWATRLFLPRVFREELRRLEAVASEG